MAKNHGKATASLKKSDKSAKTKKATNQHLSEEYIVDSDDEQAVQQSQSSRKPEKKLEKADKLKKKSIIETEASSESDSSSSAEAESSVDDSNSDESESESEDEENESSAEREVVTSNQTEARSKQSKSTSKVNGVKRKATPQSSSESEESSSESDSDSSADPSSTSEREPKRARSSKNSRPVEPNSAIPDVPFIPPEGFTALSHDPTSSNLNASSLRGKQIWYITAPRGVPLSSLTEFALEDIRKQTPILSHRDTEYSLCEVSSNEKSPTLFLPGQNGYSATPIQITRSLRLQQHVELPNLTSRQASQRTGSEAASDVARASVNTIRPQPKGLRMRFRPAGFGGGRPGQIGSSSEEDADSEDDDNDNYRSKTKTKSSASAGALQFPKTLGAHEPSHRRDEVAIRAKSSKKDKTKGHAVDGANDKASSSLLSATPSKKHKKKHDKTHENGSVSTVAHTPVQKVVAPDNDVIMDDDEPTRSKDGTQKRSKEEKARRKEEKRLRKEARAGKRRQENEIE